MHNTIVMSMEQVNELLEYINEKQYEKDINTVIPNHQHHNCIPLSSDDFPLLKPSSVTFYS